MPKPVGVPNSVFAMHSPDTGAADSKRKSPMRRLDPYAVKIETGVPIPPLGAGQSVYGQLADRLQVGDMVRLPTQQANGFVAHLKARRLPHVRRRVDRGCYGVWRTEHWPSESEAPRATAKRTKAPRATKKPPRR